MKAKRLYVVTGPHESGKSTAVATFLPPDRLSEAIIVDTEDSMSDILDNLDAAGLSFGKYIRMYDRLTKNQRGNILDAIANGRLPWVDSNVKMSALVDFYQYFIDTVNTALKDNLSGGKPKFTYLGIDTVEPFEAGLAAFVEANPRKVGWSRDYSYGRRETEGVRPLYEGIMEACHARGIQDFCFSSHLKPVWEEMGPKKVRRVPNKVAMGGRIVVLSRLSSQMWWLVPNVGNQDGAPAALRLKARKGKVEIVDGKWKISSVLPRRIPHFTWDDVRRFEQDGCDLVNPPQDQVPTKAELEMISEFLNEEQMKLMVLGTEAELRLMEQENQPVLHRKEQKAEANEVQRDAARLRVQELSLDNPIDKIEAMLVEEGYPIPVARMAVKDIGED